jgi:hypothetical protein
MLATLWSDSEFAGRLHIKLSCDRQILSLLKFTDARPGPQTEYAIDLPAVVSFVLKRLLHPLDIVRGRFLRHFAAAIDPRINRRRGWSRDPRCHQEEDNPRASNFAGEQHYFSPIL